MKKIALVTGASRGIGKATALALARDGWTVHVNYIQSRAAAEAVAAQTGGMAICADVSDGQAVEAMFEKIGPVDLLVNNAGVAVYGLLTDLDPAVWQRLFDVNVTGMYNCCRCAIPPMVHEKAGHIINLASILGTNGASCEVAYSATKGAVVSFTKALAKELGVYQIRVNCVSPGLIDTPMNAMFSEDDLRPVVDATPLGRAGTPDEAAACALFLCESDASFVTGQVLSQRRFCDLTMKKRSPLAICKRGSFVFRYSSLPETVSSRTSRLGLPTTFSSSRRSFPTHRTFCKSVRKLPATVTCSTARVCFPFSTRNPAARSEKSPVTALSPASR